MTNAPTPAGMAETMTDTTAGEGEDAMFDLLCKAFRANIYDHPHKSLGPMDEHTVTLFATVASEALAAQPSAAPVREEGWPEWFTTDVVEVEYHDGNGETHMYPWEVDWGNVSRWRPQPTALATREEAPAEAGEDAIKAACVAWHQAKGENPFNALYHGAWCGSFPHQTGPERWTFTVPAMKQAVEAYLRAQPQAREEAQPVLTVWYGSMPESNGRQNWTAILHRKGDTGFDVHVNGFCFARSEYPDRVRYEADLMRWIIGELAEKPNILDCDANAHSGYVAPTPPAPEAEKLRVAVEALEPFGKVYDNVRSKPGAYIVTGAAGITVSDLRQAAEALAALQQEGR